MFSLVQIWRIGAFTSNKLLPIYHMFSWNSIVYGGHTVRFLYTLNWLAVMSSWYHSCASWLVHQYWTRRTTAYQNPCSIKKFGNIAPFLQLLSPFLRSLVLCPGDVFFHGLLCPTKFAYLASNTYVLLARYASFHCWAWHSAEKENKQH